MQSEAWCEALCELYDASCDPCRRTPGKVRYLEAIDALMVVVLIEMGLQKVASDQSLDLLLVEAFEGPLRGRVVNRLGGKSSSEDNKFGEG